MILHTEGGEFFVPQALHRLVVEVDVRDFEATRQGLCRDREAVVLRGDFDAARVAIQDRLVAASMSELELVGFGSAGEAHQLVTETDSEDRYLTKQFANRIDCVGERLRIARPVRQKHAVWFVGQDFGSRHVSGDDCDSTAKVAQMSQDVPLHAVVDRDHMEFASVTHGLSRCEVRQWGKALGPLERFRGHDLANEIASDKCGAGLRFLHQRGIVEIGRRKDARHRAASPQPPHERPCIDPFDPDHVCLTQVLVKRHR